MGVRSKINAISLNVKINKRKSVDICGYKLPINVQNFMQKVSTQAKISSKVVGGGLLFWLTLYTYKCTEQCQTQAHCVNRENKKAVLSQRWPRNAPIHGCPENFRDSLTTPMATIPNIYHGLLFRSSLWMFIQNLKSVALPVPEIRG